MQRFYEAGGPVRLVQPGFAYNSNINSDFLSVEQLLPLIREHLDLSFQPV